MTDHPVEAEHAETEPVNDGGAGPSGRRAWRVLAVVGLAVVSAIATVAVTGGGGGSGPAPLDLSTVSDNIAGHYRYAMAHGAAYEEIPCWCGCQQYLGHGNLKDCFIRPDGKGWGAHAAGCGVCNGEAAIGERMLDDGKTPADITEAVNAEFGTTAITIPRR